MIDQWLYQVRLTLTPEAAALVRQSPDDPQLQPLMAVLKRHDTQIKCQYDAFADYVAEAERLGVDQFPLYHWTRATIENPEKKAKYLLAFTLYAGGDEVYAKDKAAALMAALEPLAPGPVISHIRLIDSNPANNPQPPEEYRPENIRSG